jgi:hypothetical protein
MPLFCDLKKKLHGLSPRANYTDRATVLWPELNWISLFHRRLNISSHKLLIQRELWHWWIIELLVMSDIRWTVLFCDVTFCVSYLAETKVGALQPYVCTYVALVVITDRRLAYSLAVCLPLPRSSRFWSLLMKYPITVAAGSKAWTVFELSKAMVVASNSTWGFDV